MSSLLRLSVNKTKKESIYIKLNTLFYYGGTDDKNTRKEEHQVN